MDERFVPLATLLGAATLEAPASAQRRDASVTAPPPAADEKTSAVLESVCAEIALLRLAAVEALERAAERALRGLAGEVLGRELLLAPHDVATLVRQALEAFAIHAPLALVLAPGDAAGVTAPLPIRADPTLAPGDVILEVGDGAFESVAAFRLSELVARALEGGT